jgi:hypothetical protein
MYESGKLVPGYEGARGKFMLFVWYGKRDGDINMHMECGYEGDE